MARRFFGTDGIRGRANQFPMTAEIALKAAMATGAHYKSGDHRHRVVIGKDTRLSCYMLEQAMTSGFCSVGLDVILLGPLPTPAVASVTRSMRADLGVMISASHNDFADNGLKFFGPDGFKLTDITEQTIEGMIDKIDEDKGKDILVDSPELGRVSRLNDVEGRYIELVKKTFPSSQSFAGLKVVLDCANGAAYRVAPTVLYELGATVIPIGCSPDGVNINDNCGATKPAQLQQAVLSSGADVGIALDGDADRIIIVDNKGQVVDGDQIMAMIAKSWHERGVLKGDGIVATVMSNMGLERYLNGLDLQLERTKVGDRYVLEAMRNKGFNFGGEQSGHMIMTDFSTTGDGLLAAVQVLADLVNKGVPASEAFHAFDVVPQVLKSVKYKCANPLEDASFKKALASFEKDLGDSGRIVIRKSGTEPVIRVMAEGDDASKVNEAVDALCDAVQQAA